MGAAKERNKEQNREHCLKDVVVDQTVCKGCYIEETEKRDLDDT